MNGQTRRSCCSVPTIIVQLFCNSITLYLFKCVFVCVFKIKQGKSVPFLRTRSLTGIFYCIMQKRRNLHFIHTPFLPPLSHIKNILKCLNCEIKSQQCSAVNFSSASISICIFMISSCTFRDFFPLGLCLI